MSVKSNLKISMSWMLKMCNITDVFKRIIMFLKSNWKLDYVLIVTKSVVISEAFNHTKDPKKPRIGSHHLITKQIIIIMSATVAICSTKIID